MVVFATPDFGASGGVVCFVFVVWAVVLLSAVVSFFRGLKSLETRTTKGRMKGGALFAASLLVPLCCCVAPPYIQRLVYGTYPIKEYPRGKVQEGMSKDEVEAVLGRPYMSTKRDEEEAWYYWIDSYCINWACVRFGPDGRVSGIHGS